MTKVRGFLVIGGISLKISGPTLSTENLAPPTQLTIEERKRQMSIRLSNLPKPVGK